MLNQAEVDFRVGPWFVIPDRLQGRGPDGRPMMVANMAEADGMKASGPSTGSDRTKLELIRRGRKLELQPQSGHTMQPGSQRGVARSLGELEVPPQILRWWRTVQPHSRNCFLSTGEVDQWMVFESSIWRSQAAQDSSIARRP